MPAAGKEKHVIHLMIRLYCRKHHHGSDLCESCRELEDYSFTRIDNCPYISNKPKCSKCQTHCFRNKKREEIRNVMRYSGPRMILYHPLIALRHMLR